jgi:hypothetical protein
MTIAAITTDSSVAVHLRAIKWGLLVVRLVHTAFTQEVGMIETTTMTNRKMEEVLTAEALVEAVVGVHHPVEEVDSMIAEAFVAAVEEGVAALEEEAVFHRTVTITTVVGVPMITTVVGAPMITMAVGTIGTIGLIETTTTAFKMEGALVEITRFPLTM